MCRAQPHQNSVPANRVLSDVPSTVMKSHQNSVPANRVLSDEHSDEVTSEQCSC